LVIQHKPLFDESIEARFGPALADKFSQKAAWAPIFSSCNVFITISWDSSHRSERYWKRYF